MKPLFFMFIILALSLNLGMAQDHFMDATPENRARMQVEWLQQKLGLDVPAQNAVYSVILKYAQKIDTLKNSESGNKDKFKELESILKAKDKEMSIVLSPQQYETYLNTKKDMREDMNMQFRNRRK